MAGGGGRDVAEFVASVIVAAMNEESMRVTEYWKVPESNVKSSAEAVVYSNQDVVNILASKAERTKR